MAKEDNLKRGDNGAWWHARTEISVDQLRSMEIEFDAGQWTDKTITALRKVWDLGFSTQQIGLFLQFSKNAIIGKAHRLDLPSRPSPIVRSDQPYRPRILRIVGPTLPPLPSVAAVEIVAPVVVQEAPAVSPRLKEVIAMKLPKVVAVPVRVVKPEPTPEPATTFIARSGKCQWTDSEVWPWVFCGDATDGGSWCTCHRRIVFVRASAGIRVAEGKTMGPYREMPTAGRWAAE